jgi:hypothetical protein
VRELEPIEKPLLAMLDRLGLAEPDLLAKVAGEWESLAGEPWAGRSRPVLIRNRELVVEAAAPSLVGLLRYAVGDLMRSLDGRFGQGIFESVRVQGSGPKGGR